MLSPKNSWHIVFSPHLPTLAGMETEIVLPDIVPAMTGGNFNTQVIATLMWKQAFTFFDSGRGAALAIILLVAVTPVMWYNLRQFRGRAI